MTDDTKFGPGSLRVYRPDGTHKDLGIIRDLTVTMTILPVQREVSDEARRGIEERCWGPTGPLMAPGVSDGRPWLKIDVLNTYVRNDTLYEACGISWTLLDIQRFLQKCRWEWGPVGWCLIYHGAKSRGRGNKAWYGSFWSKGKTIRAHKFFAVAVLGLRPRPNREDELDHHCFNTRCVSCVQVLAFEDNQKRIRRRKDYDTQA